MKDLSLHILDIAQNSVSAKATNISISITEDLLINLLTITIEDNGTGMSAETLQKVTDPYFTSRTTRKVGMGLPLFRHSAEQSGGKMAIQSEVGKGTKVTATFKLDNIDRPPVGDIAGVMMILVGANPEIEFRYTHNRAEKKYVFDTHEVKEVLDGMPLSDPTVIRYLKEMINENLNDL